MRLGLVLVWISFFPAAGCIGQPQSGPTSAAVTRIPCAGCVVDGGGVLAPPNTPPPSGGTFTIHARGKMCLDFGGQAYWTVGAPVTLYWCNGTIAQMFDVKEVNSGHDVTLHLGTGAESNYCIGARGGPVAGATLEIETCDGSEGQQFALDGDSIIAGHRTAPVKTQSLIFLPPVTGVGTILRQLVAAPASHVTGAKTPIVLEPRQLTEDEDLRFVATDGSNWPPHSGFVTTPTDAAGLEKAVKSATWGTVLVVPDGATIDLKGTIDPSNPTSIPPGVTLRGDRRFTDNGPVIEDSQNEKGELFNIAQNDVRVTGLRFQGAGSGTDQAPNLAGVRVTDGFRVTIDHNEFSRFTTAAVNVYGTAPADENVCPLDPPPQPRPTPLRISGNFLHHNIAKNQGYGVATDRGGFPLVERNVAYQNRHTITSAYDVLSGYVATDNFVLHQAPVYGFLGQDHTANFDVHGSLSENCGDRSAGNAGDYVVIEDNTLLSTDRPNIKIRGESCRTGLVDGNLFSEGQDIETVSAGNCYSAIRGAVINYSISGFVADSPPHLTITSNNGYSQPAPVDQIAVGDFDGDGQDDLFVTTGNDWYYSSGGKSEWRWLRRNNERVDDLRFGDLDGDGKTDVIRVVGSTVQVSWDGVSSWLPLTTAPAALPITDYAIGNFDGDRLHGDDIFATDGATWYVARSGGNFVPTGQTSSVPGSEMRFGDFDGDGKTDVFAIIGGRWSFSSDAAGSWQPLIGAPTTSNVDGLLVGDFDGDGKTDIGLYWVTSFGISNTWQFAFSSAARAPFGPTRTTTAPNSPPATTAPAQWSGHFQGGKLSEVVWWDGDEFDIGAGTAPNAKLSRQSMK